VVLCFEKGVGENSGERKQTAWEDRKKKGESQDGEQRQHVQQASHYQAVYPKITSFFHF